MLNEHSSSQLETTSPRTDSGLSSLLRSGLPPIEIGAGSITLSCGAITYRRLTSDAHDLAVAHLMRLPERQRYLRFFAACGAAVLSRRYAEVDPACLRLYGAFAGERMVGMLELSGTAHRSDLELAVSVDVEWQGAGIGTCLGRLAVSAASLLRSDHLTMICSVGNQPMRRIGDRLGFSFHVEDGFDYGRLELERGLARG